MLWRDIDLAGSRIFIGRSKTAAGLREIEILPILRDILATYKAIAYRGDPDALVFPTLTGARRDADNLRARVLTAVFERADELLAQRGLVPLPKRLTIHKLRHAFASVLIALGEDPVSVMRQIGHTDPQFTLRVYAHMMSRDPAERARLKALVRGERVFARTAPPPKPVDLAEYEARSSPPWPSVAAAPRGGRSSPLSPRLWPTATARQTSNRCQAVGLAGSRVWARPAPDWSSTVGLRQDASGECRGQGRRDRIGGSGMILVDLAI